MVVLDRSTPVRNISVEDAIENLKRSIMRMERIYEMSSSEMLTAVQTGQRVDTAEIAVWMIQYRELQYLTT